MISKGFYFSSKIEKNKGDWDFKDRLVGSLSNHDDDGNKNPSNLLIWQWLRLISRELKQPRRRQQQKPPNLNIWQWKKIFVHALHVHFSSFDIL